ncbi:MAG: hypothetical protein WB679_10300, partial [Terracidiphilus sp.]
PTDHLKWVGRSNCRTYRVFIPRLTLFDFVIQPRARGRNQQLCFSGNAATPPPGDGHEPFLAQASQPSLSTDDFVVDTRFRQGLLEGTFEVFCQGLGDRRKPIQFPPEVGRWFETFDAELTQLLLLLGENDRLAAFTKALRISVEDCVTSVFQLDRKPFGIDYDLHARRQADEIVGVSQGIGFVEIIDAPTKPTLAISPSAEAVYMQVTNCENSRRMAEIGAHRWP